MFRKLRIREGLGGIWSGARCSGSVALWRFGTGRSSIVTGSSEICCQVRERDAKDTAGDRVIACGGKVARFGHERAGLSRGKLARKRSHA